MDSKRNRSTGDLYKYGTRGSEEYTKLTETLMLAKQRRRKLEENLRILREMVWDDFFCFVLFLFLNTFSKATRRQN